MQVVAAQASRTATRCRSERATGRLAAAFRRGVLARFGVSMMGAGPPSRPSAPISGALAAASTLRGAVRRQSHRSGVPGHVQMDLSGARYGISRGLSARADRRAEKQAHRRRKRTRRVATFGVVGRYLGANVRYARRAAVRLSGPRLGCPADLRGARRESAPNRPSSSAPPTRGRPRPPPLEAMKVVIVFRRSVILRRPAARPSAR
jgi:hypothetical protein